MPLYTHMHYRQRLVRRCIRVLKISGMLLVLSSITAAALLVDGGTSPDVVTKLWLAALSYILAGTVVLITLMVFVYDVANIVRDTRSKS